MPIRLGVLLPAHKKRKIKIPERIFKLCAQANIEIFDLDMAIDEFDHLQPFDVFLHKVSDYYNECSPVEANLKINKVQRFVEKYGKMKVIDDIDESKRLTDRVYQTKLLKSCETRVDGIDIFVPKIVEISSGLSIEDVNKLIFDNNIKFPILAKPIVASVTDNAHEMRLVFSQDHLKDLKLPCLIQEFCNHGGVVYKIYVVGDSFSICEKPSVKDVVTESKETLIFDTRNVSKIGKSFLPDLHDSDPNKRKWTTSDENPGLLNKKVVTELCILLRKLTNLYLFGIDILIDSKSGNYALIDVNQFPGYTGVNDQFFPYQLVELVKTLAMDKET